MAINIYKLKMIKEDTVEYSTTIKSPADIAALAREVLEMHEMAEENFVIVCLNTKFQFPYCVGKFNSIHM